MFTQLQPPIPMETPKGEGLAYGVIDYGPDYDLLWVVFDNTTGECWTWPNPKIRGVKNITMNRATPALPKLSPTLDAQPLTAHNGNKSNGTHRH